MEELSEFDRRLKSVSFLVNLILEIVKRTKVYKNKHLKEGYCKKKKKKEKKCKCPALLSGLFVCV